MRILSLSQQARGRPVELGHLASFAIAILQAIPRTPALLILRIFHRYVTPMCAIVCALLLQPSAGAQIVTATIPVGIYPVAVAVNPVTNKIYVATSRGTVTVIDGGTNTVCNTCTVAAGTTPYAVAVNPATNKIYVANHNNNNVTGIDGTTNATTTVAAGLPPQPQDVDHSRPQTLP